MSSAPSARAFSCIRAVVARQPPLRAARTCTASLPELRNTPRHRSATEYVCPSATPTRLLPGPMSASSSSDTSCRTPAGRTGSTVRANRVFSVLAGGSLRCAFAAASTSPLSASATSQDSAERSGTSGAARSGLTCVPGRKRSDGFGVCARDGAPACGAPGGAATALGPRARAPAAQKTPADSPTREGNPIFI